MWNQLMFPVFMCHIIHHIISNILFKDFDFVVQYENNEQNKTKGKHVEPTDVPLICVPCNPQFDRINCQSLLYQIGNYRVLYMQHVLISIHMFVTCN